MSTERRVVSPGTAPRWRWAHLLSVVGLVLLVAWFPFYLLVSLIAPWWMVFPAMLVWAGFLFLVVRWFRTHPVWALLAGAASIAVWHAAGFLLDAVVGWAA